MTVRDWLLTIDFKPLYNFYVSIDDVTTGEILWCDYSVDNDKIPKDVLKRKIKNVNMYTEVDNQTIININVF